MKSSSPQKYDVVVAGAGLGGLFAAAKLVKEGKKVLLLERHSIAGGYASFFKRKGFRFEASLHALDGLFSEGSIRNMAFFEEFGLDKEINFIRLHEFFRVIGPDLDVNIPDTVEGAKAAYLSECPDEKESIDHFFSQAEKVYNQVMTVRDASFKDLLNLPKFLLSKIDLIVNFRRSLGEFMDKMTSSDKLKMLICANASYYHDDPDKYSVIHFLAAQASYLSGGAAQITGGSYSMITKLLEFIIQNSGEIRFNADVTAVNLTKGAVSGVTYRDLRTKEETTLETKTVVGNLPFPQLVSLLPEKAAQKLNKRYKKYTKSPSVYQIYFGLKKPLSSVGIDNYSSIIFPDGYDDFNDMFHHNYNKNYGERILFLTNYSALDLFPSEGNQPTATCTVLDTMDGWENLSKEEYTAKKEKHCEEILEDMEKRFPGFRDNIEYISTASPKTFERYTGNPGGSIYGFSQDIRQLGPQRPRNRTKIPGLYLASAWSFPGGGMIPAAKSGYYAAEEILKRK